MDIPRKFRLTAFGETILRIELERQEAFLNTPCPVETCPVGKPDWWNSLGDDSPAQDAAATNHFQEKHVAS